jgi:hypothetical protein
VRGTAPKAKAAVVVSAVIFVAVMLFVFVVIPMFSSPKPQIMSFEEAIEAAGGSANPEDFISYGTTGKLEGDPFVHESGVTGYLTWLALNGTIYQAEYPSGKALGEYMQTFQSDWNPPDGYYIWMLNYGGGETIWVEARNGTILNHTPRR